MKILKRIDRIPPLISNFMSMLICTGIALLVSSFFDGIQADGIAQGIIFGAFCALVVKGALECSDRAGWMALTGRFKKDDRRKLFSFF